MCVIAVLNNRCQNWKIEKMELPDDDCKILTESKYLLVFRGALDDALCLPVIVMLVGIVILIPIGFAYASILCIIGTKSVSG